MTQKRKGANATLKAPRLSLQTLENASKEESIQDSTRFEQLLFSHHDLSQQRGQHVSFDQVLLQQVQLNATTLQKSSVLDSRFKVCDLANAEWPEANLTRVELLDCHLTGFQAAEARFQDMLFKDCQAHFASFALAIFKSVRFEDCDLSEANFYQADLTGVIFTRCNLSSADFSSAKLVGADLRGCKIDGIRIGPRELQGATIDMTQAVSFVRGLGIKVEPLSEEVVK